MNNPIIQKSLEADGNITDYRIVKRDTSDDLVIQAAANTDKLLGVVGAKGQSTGYAAVDGDDIDVIVLGITEVEAGGVFVMGDKLTSDSSGKAVKVTAAMMFAGLVHCIGTAMMDAAADGDIAAVNVMPHIIPKANTVGGAVMTVNAEAANVINVGIQLNDADGNAMAQAASVVAYLSADAAGQTIATAHSSSPAIGTDGLLQALVTDLTFLLTSEADGDIDIDFTETGALTVYLCIVLPDGSLSISDAITHAA